jgi:predicted nuclease of predicted toxin-antitoxin system
MIVLVDQNISHRIVPQIAFLFDKLTHVKTLGWIDWNDHHIFISAKKQRFDAIITLDEDFNKLLLQHGTPPKVIWLKTGNCSTARLTEIIISHKDAILNFMSNLDFDCLELYG